MGDKKNSVHIIFIAIHYRIFYARLYFRSSTDNIFHATFRPREQRAIKNIWKMYRPQILIGEKKEGEQKNDPPFQALRRSTQFFNTASEKYPLLPFVHLYICIVPFCCRSRTLLCARQSLPHPLE